MSKYVNDSVHWYMGELTSRVVAESGIPSDRFHLGKIMMQCMKDDPDFILQIDGATDESETNSSVLARTVRCATSLRNLGLQHGDVIVLMAPNHIDLAIPFYAALFCGFSMAAVDRTLALSELQSTFSVCRPRAIFCQSDKAPDIQIALNELDLNAQIVIFDRGDYLLNFSDFMDQYGDDTTVEDFKCEDFDPTDTIAFLIATSGTTGMPKSAACTHKNIVTTCPYLWSGSRTFPSPTRLALLAAPLQWLTAIMTFTISTVLRHPRLISSKPLTQEFAYHLINKYKPSFTILSPTMMTTLLKPGDRDQCDFSCFDLIMLGGSAVPVDLVAEVKKVTPNTKVLNAYGMSELTNIAFHADGSPVGSCGKPMGCLEYRLVDLETNSDIEEPNTPGELWLKGPGIFKISPVEVEAVILQHPGVLDVAVTGIPDPECGELPVACVVPVPGHAPTAQEIKDLVKDNLSDAKQLRGGVIFVSAIPVTASTKVHRRKLKEIALTTPRE